MRLTVRHSFDFGIDRDLVGSDLVRPEAWDAVRLHTGGPFALPADRAAWEAQAEAASQLPARAQAIRGWARSAGARRLVSYGVGTAMLEFHLHRIDPDLFLTITDYAPETVQRLRSLFAEVEVRHHDLRSDGPLGADVHLLHRIDSELSDEEWLGLLARFRGERLLVVATEVAEVRRVLLELLLRVRRPGASRAGWLRTRDAFEGLWQPTHDARPIRIVDLWGWDLDATYDAQSAGRPSPAERE